MRLPVLTPRMLISGFLAAILSGASANGFTKDTGLIFVSIENSNSMQSILSPGMTSP